MPRSGVCILTLKKEEGLKLILERNEVKDLKNLQANKLSVEMRLLHNTVSWIFFSKTERFDWVTKKT